MRGTFLGQLIRSAWWEVDYWSRREYHLTKYDSYVRGCLDTARTLYASILLWADTEEYYQHGNAD